MPSVALVTEAFDGLAALAAKGLGLPEINVHKFPHPLNPLPREEVEVIGRAAIRDIVQRLLKH